MNFGSSRYFQCHDLKMGQKRMTHKGFLLGLKTYNT